MEYKTLKYFFIIIFLIFTQPTLAQTSLEEQAERKANELISESLKAQNTYGKNINNKIEEYNEFALKHNQKLYQFQFISSIIIFIMVIFIIVFGLWLSWLQFAKKTKITDSSLEVGLSGIKISSDILGLLILVISFVFFYLYLKTVYPVNITAEQSLQKISH